MHLKRLGERFSFGQDGFEAVAVGHLRALGLDAHGVGRVEFGLGGFVGSLVAKLE